MDCVIMAGGRGTRFWPYSRKSRPKQMLKIVGDSTLLQMTVDRLRKIKAVRDMYIVTGEDLAPLIRQEIRGVTPENILVEPEGKNTAPCIGLAAIRIARQDPDGIMGVFPADHLVVGHRNFEQALSTAGHLALKKRALITIGIPPSYPSTGFGYIQFAPQSDEDHLDAFRVRTFAEKPHLALAERFLKSGDFLWNSGMFIWQTAAFLEEMITHMPDLHHHLMRIKTRLARSADAGFKDIWDDITPESVDYGLMEKSQNIYVVKAHFEWNDVGSWNAVYEISPKNKTGNVIRGDGLILEGEGNYLQSNGRFTAVIGADDLIIVNTQDATLVVRKDKVESVKALVEILEKKQRHDLI